MMWGEELYGWILGFLLSDGVMLLIAFLLVFLGLKVAMALIGAEDHKAAAPVLPRFRLSEGANPYVQIAEALERGNQEALLWLMSQTTRRSRIVRALNSVAVDLLLGVASLLTVSGVYIVVRALPVQGWVIILMIMAAVALVGIAYWRVKD
ncbi:MAG: hypothetical protein Q6352_004995 [Candidatus Freyrarchaeum guaymaensis]